MKVNICISIVLVVFVMFISTCGSKANIQKESFGRTPDGKQIGLYTFYHANPIEAFKGHEHQHPEVAVDYQGGPYVVDEYGGTFWTKEYIEKEPHTGTYSRGKAGYGKTADETEEIIADLTEIILDNPNIAGYCYTELFDIEQEVNGIYTYECEPKFDI
jgi:hypothetical protein